MNIDYLKNSVKHNETFKKKKNKFERVNENILNIHKPRGSKIEINYI